MGKIAVDEDELEELGHLAMDKVGVEAEGEQLLRSGTASRRVRAEIADKLSRIAAMTPKGVIQTDSVLMLREDRDR